VHKALCLGWGKAVVRGAPQVVPGVAVFAAVRRVEGFDRGLGQVGAGKAGSRERWRWEQSASVAPADEIEGVGRAWLTLQ
jgi:hypothetical protein